MVPKSIRRSTWKRNGFIGPPWAGGCEKSAARGHATLGDARRGERNFKFE
jgi:hypothetical protein